MRLCDETFNENNFARAAHRSAFGASARSAQYTPGTTR